MDSFGRKHAIIVIPITVTLVGVHVPVLVTRVPVDVDHEALSYSQRSISLLLELSQSCILFGASKPTNHKYQLSNFLKSKQCTLAQAIADVIPTFLASKSLYLSRSQNIARNFKNSLGSEGTRVKSRVT